MSACRRIVIDLPNELAGELETLAQEEQTSHEELLCKAVQCYIETCKHLDNIEQMKKGYKEMGLINITLAEEGLYGGISKK
ncbi:CopG family transcriptional regulator [Pectinatus sottacetonis]|uniref:CopG family transcriptional regulator n=1 Tax=Pectinatus sottacetonis TaxID=1002795 RepID=UPI0018C53681|nr:CopG family transcriptional regulator [Pectinatus sottacetonis]